MADATVNAEMNKSTIPRNRDHSVPYRFRNSSFVLSSSGTTHHYKGEKIERTMVHQNRERSVPYLFGNSSIEQVRSGTTQHYLQYFSNLQSYSGVVATNCLRNVTDVQKTEDLKQFLYHICESDEELAHRMAVMKKLKEHFNLWIKQINIKMNIDERVSGKLLIYGSYQMGAHIKGADIDTICIAPWHVNRHEFFSSFFDILQEQIDVKNLHAIKFSYVPLIKMVYDGFPVDIAFVRLPLCNITDDLNLQNFNILRNLDLPCIRSLNGFRTVAEILRLVPNRETFSLALRAIKLWAKRQGIYSNMLGYIGGASYAILTAKTCQMYPTATASTVVQKFFFVFSQWPWPTPVILKVPEKDYFNLNQWDPRFNPNDRLHLMPIITPAYPHQNSSVNVSCSTQKLLQDAFKNGFSVINDIMSGKKKWEALFEPVDFFSKYKYFIILITTVLSDEDQAAWNGLVESKIRLLILNLEKYTNIELACVYPKSYRPLGTYKSMWFIGLLPVKMNFNLDLTNEITTFKELIFEKACYGDLYKKGMKIEFKYAKRKELSQYLSPTDN